MLNRLRAKQLQAPVVLSLAIAAAAIIATFTATTACGSAGERAERMSSAPDPSRNGASALAETGRPARLDDAGALTMPGKNSPGAIEKSSEKMTASGFPASAAPEALRSGPSSMPDRDTSAYHDQPILKAGETDDNEKWQEYLSYLGRYTGPEIHERDVSRRVLITVRDQDGRTVQGALVTVRQDGAELERGLTYADGRTLYFPEKGRDGAFAVSAEKADTRGGAKFEIGQGNEWTVVLGHNPEAPAKTGLDVLFLLDATGSMADEIDRIKSTLHSIAAQVSDLPQEPDLRFGMVAYRDRGDEYVTRVYEFEGDVQAFQKAIDEVEANGGGDTPESLNEALHEAVGSVRWRGQDTVRLIFLVADAPPHLDYEQDYDYAQETAIAREKGIKVFAVASSGLDHQGEYIFRQIAQQTMGRFIFILYETGPQGGMDTPHDVGSDFSVNNLDGLIVRLIREELESMRKGNDR